MTVVAQHVAHHRHLSALYKELLADVEGITLHENPAPSFDSNYWLNTILIAPSLRVNGEDLAYQTVASGAVGGVGAVAHTPQSLRTQCEPNANVEAMRLALDAAGIEARPLWKPMHCQPVFASAPAYINGVSEHLFAQGLCIPGGPCVSADDVRYIVEQIKAAIAPR